MGQIAAGDSRADDSPATIRETDSDLDGSPAPESNARQLFFGSGSLGEAARTIWRLIGS